MIKEKLKSWDPIKGNILNNTAVSCYLLMIFADLLIGSISSSIAI